MQKMGLSQREIEKIKEDIGEEREELAELEFSIGQKFLEDTEVEKDSDLQEDIMKAIEGPKKPSGNPNPRRPNPDSVGERISNTKTSDMLDG